LRSIGGIGGPAPGEASVRDFTPADKDEAHTGAGVLQCAAIVKYCDTCHAAYPNEFNTCPKDQAALRATADLVPGMVLRGKYEVVEKLGAGGMAAVYKARHLAFGEVRAIKLVAARLCDDEGFLKRFRTEAVVTRRLQHPHAVRVDDLDTTEDGRPFIVMELVQGRNLREVIRAEGALPVARAALIGRQVASALGAAHALGITHRDIKPDNIVLAASADGGDHAKVLDFGIAKVREGTLDVGAGYTATETGMVVGTPQYMSPEQAMGKRGDELDGRSDLYSLGVALFEMITGRLPFESTTPMELVLHHVQTPPPPLQQVRPDLNLPLAVSTVVMRALQKDPGRRFRTAEEMEVALAALVALPDTTISRRPPEATPAPRPAATLAVGRNATAPPAAPTPPGRPARATRPGAHRAAATAVQGDAGGREDMPARSSSTPALVASGAVIACVLGAVLWRSATRAPAMPGPAAIEAAPVSQVAPVEAAAFGAAEVAAAPDEGNSDGRIQNEIQRLLISSAALRSQPIVVEVANGIVTLSGGVSDATLAQLAGSFAASVPGVRQVFTTLQVPAAAAPADAAGPSVADPTPAAPAASARSAADADRPGPGEGAGGPGSALSHVEQARREVAAGNIPGAMQACRNALQAEPSNPIGEECLRKVQAMGGRRPPPPPRR
jgi:serine/threonine protein kinase